MPNDTRKPGGARQRTRKPLVLPDVTGMTSREAAHAYLDAGFMPHPWKPKQRGGKWEKVSCRAGFSFGDASVIETHESIDEWPDSWRCGLACSPVTGTLVTDVDVLAEFEGWDAGGVDILDFVQVATGRDSGHHLYYDARDLAPEDWPRQGNIPGGQVKSNGFVAAPGSLHADGKRRYRVITGNRTLPRMTPELARVYRGAREATNQGGSGSGAEVPCAAPDGLWRAALDAGDGQQRGAIFAWARDAHDRGLADEEILDRLELAVHKGELRSWRRSDPWNRAGLQAAAIPTAGWRHVAPARMSELDGIENVGRAGRRQSRLTQTYDNVEDEDVEWIWPRYLARRILTQVDGEKGQAKSFINADIAARATRGRPMPGEQEAVCGPMGVILFAEDVSSQLKKQLMAAGADLSMVHYPDPEWREAVKRAKQKAESRSGTRRREKDEDISLLLPKGAPIMMEMIRQSGAGLAIWDPITDYLDESISTGIDASVRRAIEPLARGLEKIGAAGLSLRHMNKDSRLGARHRGGGTTAFQNRARVHLVTGRLSAEYADLGTFGLSMVDNNYVPRVEGTLAYDVVNSHIKLDNLGNMVGKIKWRGIQDIDPDTLTRGDARDGRPGPDPIKSMAIEEVLGEMGEVSEKWDADEAKREINRRLVSRGFSEVNKNTIEKAKRSYGITSKQERSGWYWIWPGKKRIRAARA